MLPFIMIKTMVTLR